MSSLRQLVAEKRDLPIRCVEKECRPVAMVTFCPWQAKEWGLPWCRLDAVSYCNEEELERVELFFPHHQVIMVGENLRGVMEGINNFEIYCMRDLPAAHRASLEPFEVFITRLEVRSHASP